jgi:hypothetical protein
VLTGAAASLRKGQGLTFESEAQVLQTARMVRLDWQRSIQTAAAAPCLREVFAKELGTKATLVSFGRIPFPHVGGESAAFRALFDVNAQGQAVRIMLELVAVVRGRTEITLTAAAPAAAQRAVSAADVRLARILAGRARA